ncbi:MAG: alkaline phosphatase family protein [Solirubrobacteraceae bacterium]
MSRRIIFGVTAVAAALALGASAGGAAAKMCGVRTSAGTYKHVVVVFMENHSFTQIQTSGDTTYIHSLEAACGLATNYHNITHPSLPNYLAAVDGGTLHAVTTPYKNDCTPSQGSMICPLSPANNIFHQLDMRSRLWKGYAEDMPSPCDNANSGLYAARHNPAVYFSDLADSCPTRDVALGTTSSSPLLTDFSSDATAPAYSTVTPNLCNDMHGPCPGGANTTLAGDNFLKAWIPKITSTPVYKLGHTVVVVTWDEGEGGSHTTGEDCATNTSDSSCKVVTIVIAPSVRAGLRRPKLLNHYSLLRTSEELLKLPKLGQANGANSMLIPFNL